MIVAAYLGSPKMLSMVEAATRVQQNNDKAVSFAVGAAKILEKVILVRSWCAAKILEKVILVRSWW
jgi:type III secretory pathway component EscS